MEGDKPKIRVKPLPASQIRIRQMPHTFHSIDLLSERFADDHTGRCGFWSLEEGEESHFNSCPIPLLRFLLNFSISSRITALRVTKGYALARALIKPDVGMPTHFEAHSSYISSCSEPSIAYLPYFGRITSNPSVIG